MLQLLATDVILWAGAVVLLLLGIGWIWTGLMRRAERIRHLSSAQAILRFQDAAGTSACKTSQHVRCACQSDHIARETQLLTHSYVRAQLHCAGALPAVTVVLPVKGCRHYSVRNWRSQLSLQYGA